MTKTLFLAGAAALALAGNAFSAGQHPTSTIHGTAHHPHMAICPHFGGCAVWDQFSNSDGSAIGSQNFETAYDAYDDQAADDFSCTSKTSLKIHGVNIGTQYTTADTASSFNVFFYADAGGSPGALVGSFGSQGYTTNTGSDADIPLTKLNSKGTKIVPATLKLKCKPAVRKGPLPTYWVSVQANLDFLPNGDQAYWATRTLPDAGLYEANWQNYGPGNGFGVCPTWGTLTNCVGITDDMQFGIY